MRLDLVELDYKFLYMCYVEKIFLDVSFIWKKQKHMRRVQNYLQFGWTIAETNKLDVSKNVENKETCLLKTVLMESLALFNSAPWRNIDFIRSEQLWRKSTFSVVQWAILNSSEVYEE